MALAHYQFLKLQVFSFWRTFLFPRESLSGEPGTSVWRFSDTENVERSGNCESPIVWDFPKFRKLGLIKLHCNTYCQLSRFSRESPSFSSNHAEIPTVAFQPRSQEKSPGNEVRGHFKNLSLISLFSRFLKKENKTRNGFSALI